MLDRAPFLLQEFMHCPRELSLRGKVAVLVRDILAVLSASHCIQPCIQWYAHQLREVWARAETEVRARAETEVRARAETGGLDCLAPPRRATWGLSSHDNTQPSRSLNHRAHEGFSFLQPDQGEYSVTNLSMNSDCTCIFEF